MSHRVKYVNPHPLTDIVGSVSFDGVTFELRRGLSATLDAAKARARKGDGLGEWTKTYQQLVLATLQVAWYTETQGKVPASCQRTLEKAKAAA